jgi:pimeloyl-ACP methyl ester carboxylesterase
MVRPSRRADAPASTADPLEEKQELAMQNDIVQTSAADTLPPFDATTFWTVFRRGTVTANGVRLHFVEGGSGAPILLLPGWPQSWYVWRYVMPLLVAAGRRVIALDPRGMGDSDRPASGYDMQTVTAEIHNVVEALGLTTDGAIDVVGHDVGTWIGYAYAAEWPQDVKRLAVFDAALPGITPPPPAGIPSADVNVKTWHFAFNRLDDLPELLLHGREREFLTWLFRAKAMRPWTITPTDLDEYVRVNAAPGAIRAALSYYRHNLGPEALERSRLRAARKLAMPVLAFGADAGVGPALIETMRLVATDVRGGVFTECGHYMPEEAPRAVADQILRFTGLPITS